MEIKKEQTQADNELQLHRMNLSECSYMADPLKWNMLFDNVHKAVIKLHDITKELKKLEGKLISSLLNHLNLFCLSLDIHVSVNHGVLPY